MELWRGTRRRRDPGEALVGGERSRGSLDQGRGHLDRGGAVESAGWMDRAGGTVVGCAWVGEEGIWEDPKGESGGGALGIGGSLSG